MYKENVPTPVPANEDTTTTATQQTTHKQTRTGRVIKSTVRFSIHPLEWGSVTAEILVLLLLLFIITYHYYFIIFITIRGNFEITADQANIDRTTRYIGIL